jgi:SpoVK/Ycf46/Vps4 family AAA+-type ATPase
MKPKYNYNTFLENMDNKFNKSKTLPSSDTTSRDKDEIDKFVSLVNENYNNYHDFYYKASDLYKLCNKKSNDATRENEYVEVKENLERYNETEEKLIKEILNVIEKKSSMKKKSQKPNGNTTSVQYTNAYLSTLSSCYDKILPNMNDYIKYNTREKEEREKNNKKKKTVPKNSIIIRKKVDINATINNIKDLIDLIEKYPLNDEVEYNINMTALHKIKTELNELNNMIGMKEMKENVVDQLLYYIQDLHSTSSNGDFMHTVIYGPPGTGKTEIAKIIGRIFCNLGILKKGVFKKVTRSDLVAGYLGQTAMKTKDVIQECLGGVLFIDEAYALGNVEKRDSFSKECIDTLCEALSDYKDNLMVIIAGYESELKDCFFSYNQGLDSRFTWRFKTENYKSEDLFQIFLKKVKDAGWTVEENTKTNAEWFEKNMVYFKFFGRDIETLFSKIKIAHGRRIFCKPETDRKKITFSDLEKGFEMFLKNDDVKNRKESETMNKMLMSIYV